MKSTNFATLFFGYFDPTSDEALSQKGMVLTKGCLKN